MTKLFYVQSEDDEGTDYSAVVEAIDANDAVNQWHAWLQFSFYADYAEDVPSPPRRVFELPEKTGKPGFFHWHRENGVVEHEI